MIDNAAINSPPPEVMWSISRIAERDRVSKPNVSQIVKRLIERHGLTVTRDHLNRVSLVNVVEYDNLRSRFSNPSKDQAPDPIDRPEDDDLQPRRPQAADSRTSYDEALRQKAWFEVERRRLEAAELRGLLVRKDKVEQAITDFGQELVRIIELLPQEAETVAIALKYDDTHRLRVVLKEMSRRLRGNIANAMTKLVEGMPLEDPPLDDFMEGQSGGR